MSDLHDIADRMFAEAGGYFQQDGKCMFLVLSDERRTMLRSTGDYYRLLCAIASSVGKTIADQSDSFGEALAVMSMVNNAIYKQINDEFYGDNGEDDDQSFSVKIQRILEDDDDG